MAAYPFRPEGDPVDRIELDVPTEVSFQEVGDSGGTGMISRFEGLVYNGWRTVAKRWVLADDIGDNLDQGEVILRAVKDDGTEAYPTEIDENTKINVYEALRIRVGGKETAVMIGALIGTTAVVAGTIIAKRHKS